MRFLRLMAFLQAGLLAWLCLAMLFPDKFIV